VVQLKQGPLLVGRAVTTDAAGKWSVEGVGPGDGYYIQVSKAGYNLGTSALFSVTGPGGGADLRLTVMRIINMGISMMGNASGPGWVYTHSDKTYTLQDGASLTVMGISAGGRRLAVASGAQNVTLTLWSTTIDVSAVTDACALMLQSGSSLTLRLEGLNILKSGDNKAGIQTSGAEIRITGTGTLNVTGGSCGAGIGGGNGGSGGTIEISGGTITAQSGTQGAGIGGGNGGAGGTIKISGGTIDANSTQGASIGGGNIGAGAALTITGGTITASGDVRAFGCGGSGGFGDGSLAITPEGAFTTYTYWDDSATYPGGAGTSGTTTPYTFNSTHKWVKIVCQ
jgi:hypothetical protein